uniref:Uncharacterized protein n=1 Tax=Anopheles minimus TaxID=112268 RepID=A0A182WP43_9DIPT
MTVPVQRNSLAVLQPPRSRFMITDILAGSGPSPPSNTGPPESGDGMDPLTNGTGGHPSINQGTVDALSGSINLGATGVSPIAGIINGSTNGSEGRTPSPPNGPRDLSLALPGHGSTAMLHAGAGPLALHAAAAAAA